MIGALALSAPALLLLLALFVALAMHPYAARIGWRYLRSKKRRTVSVITAVAVAGVGLGVAALLLVLSFTSGFQEEFRSKVLGVNAHVLVLKYGLDFEEYRDVMERAREMPEVAGAAPFLINEMMLANGDRIAGVLVKGIDPELMPTVLDLPDQIQAGSLEGLRAEGAAPPVTPERVMESVEADWGWLDDVEGQDGTASEGPASEGPEPATPEPPRPAPTPSSDGFIAPDSLPDVHVPSPEEAEQALADRQGDDSLDDDQMDSFIDDLVDLGDPDAVTIVPTSELAGIVVGITLATNLGLDVGDRVNVISPLAGLDASMFGHDNAPRSREFRVIAIFSAGFQEYDTRLVYVDLFEAQHFFQHGDSVTGVEIALHDLDTAPTVSRRLERVLGGGPYHTMDWQELNHNLFTALEIQKVMLSLVIASIIFVAAFNVVATLIMIVLEKKREIAILKAMGAKSVGILLIFIVQGLVIGLVGTAVGLLLGGGACWYLEAFQFSLDPHVYLIDHLPVRTSAAEYIVTISTAIVICIIATVIPSYWAARLRPADGVRHE
ncbi:MAG TPA: ABC transporter permease [Polyangiaceae bacterium]|nr:ABC transporter permease [Polyangiaceae bacterium]